MTPAYAAQPSTADERLFSVRRLGVIIRPLEDEATEAEGVTNPACARGRDGELYLFPRLIGQGNYSRIGVVRVLSNADGDPVGVERLGVALEPEEPFEKNPFSGGGCEDPRITFLPDFDRYVMTYTAFSARGPRIALASSIDLISWERHGLVRFSPTGPMDFNGTDNKDAVVFPTFLPDPIDGSPSIGFVHRPLIPSRLPRPVARPDGSPLDERYAAQHAEARRVRLNHQSVWISYCKRPRHLDHLVNLHSHHRLMSPHEYWERAKIGAGSPPLMTRLGWLLIYHGATGHEGVRRYFRYSAGVVFLDPVRPEHILYRSRHPVFDPADEPATARSHRILFPTALDQRFDLGDPDRIDVYYGVADTQIAVASLRLPAALPVRAEVPVASGDAR